MKKSNYLNKHIFLSFLFVFLLFNLNTMAQEVQKSNATSQEDFREIDLEKLQAKKKLKHQNTKPELQAASKPNTSNTSLKKDAILAKLNYLKEQSCCEKEILELESQLND